MYKILSRLLANRLKKVLNGVIDKRQIAFVGGRSLFHGMVVENEVIDKAHRKKKKKCLVLYKLHRLGFKDNMISWIKSCLHSSSILILINGSPTSEFRMQRD